MRSISLANLDLSILDLDVAAPIIIIIEYKIEYHLN